MNKAFSTILLLLLSNTFMTLAWYGHLKFKEIKPLASLGLGGVILIAWAIALIEYCFQVPANRIGFRDFGGPFNLVQLKVIQEVLNLGVFTGFMLLAFKTEQLKLNHLLAFGLLVLAVFLVFKKG
ncbi:MAG: DMT family protein [Candidatus Sericytochromatia bacterium]